MIDLDVSLTYRFLASIFGPLPLQSCKDIVGGVEASLGRREVIYYCTLLSPRAMMSQQEI